MTGIGSLELHFVKNRARGVLGVSREAFQVNRRNVPETSPQLSPMIFWYLVQMICRNSTMISFHVLSTNVMQEYYRQLTRLRRFGLEIVPVGTIKV